MSRFGTAEEPRFFTLDPIPVCLHFTLFALIPATFTLSQPGGPALPVMLTIQPQKNCLYPLFEPSSTSLKKANSYMLLHLRLALPNLIRCQTSPKSLIYGANFRNYVRVTDFSDFYFSDF